MVESDLIQEVRHDHQEIKALLTQVAERPDAKTFAELARKIEAHETAEQDLVHPLVSVTPSGDGIAHARLAEEADGKHALERLKRMGVVDPMFVSTFAEFRQAVLRHAEHEEHEEHPLLADTLDPEQLRRLGGEFRGHERSAEQRAS